MVRQILTGGRRLTASDAAAINAARSTNGPVIVTRRRPDAGQTAGYDVFGPDEPAPVIMAAGMGGVGTRQFGLLNRSEPSIDPETGEALDLASTEIGRAVPGIRRLTIAEARQLCTFPDDFVLTGTFDQRWARLGNSVPPMMMYHVAATIRDRVFHRDLPPNRPGPTAKPPYHISAMKDVDLIPANGLTVVSTFSGCGGSTLGYRMAGFQVRWASEFVPAAQDSYRANMAPSTVLDRRDVRDVAVEELLTAAGLAAGQIDLFDGSPPCTPFSTAGKREAAWGKINRYADGAVQRTDDLFYEYARLVRGCQPRVFVAENVSGLIKGTAKGYFIRIMQELKACGYQVRAKLLDAQWLGVPQSRQRLIFVGVRNDVGLQPTFPAPLPYRYTIRDALDAMPEGPG